MHKKVNETTKQPGASYMYFLCFIETLDNKTSIITSEHILNTYMAWLTG